MKTLSLKIQSAMTKDNLSYRTLGLKISVSHSTIFQIVKNGKTALKEDVKEKLMNLSHEITESDFTKIVRSGASRQTKIGDDIKSLLEQYDSNRLMRTTELRHHYL